MLKDRFQSLFTALYSLIRRDIRTKGAILAVAIILWFSINLEKDFETTIQIPIKITNLKKGRVLLNSIPTFADVTIRGKGKVLFFSSIAKSLYFELDLSNLLNKKSFKINQSQFVNQSSENIKLISIQSPREVDVELDAYRAKFVPVVLRSFYTLLPGYLPSGKLKVNPESVFVSGPLAKVRQIDTLYTEAIVDSNLYKDWKINARLVLSDTSAITYSHKKVKVFQKISKKGTNSFKCLVQLLNAPENREIVIDPVSVSIDVFGPVDDLYELDQNDFTITANYLQLNEFDKTIKIEIKSDVKTEWKISDEFIKVIEL